MLEFHMNCFCYHLLADGGLVINKGPLQRVTEDVPGWSFCQAHVHLMAQALGGVDLESV